MRRRWTGARGRVAAAAGAASLAITLAARAQDPAAAAPPKTLVHVTFSHADGTPATDVTPADLDVRVDGSPRPVEFLSCYPTPLSVVLLVDQTTSMRMGDQVSSLAVQRAMDQWFPYALAPEDRARIGSIGRRVALSPRFTTDRRALVDAGQALRAPDALDRGGPSPIWDAVDEALQALDAEGGVRAILLITDGRASGNRLGLEDVGAHAVSAHAIVDIVGERTAAIVLPQVDGSALTIAPDTRLRWLAERTGGTFEADKPFPWSDPGPIVTRILAGLHKSCTVGFVAPVQDGHLHDLDVRVRLGGLQVHAPKAFLAGS